jgi:hypothetical protein
MGGKRQVKVTLEISLKNGTVLPVQVDMSTLADIKKLGAKLSALPAGLNKYAPGIAESKIDGLRFVKEREATAAAA